MQGIQLLANVVLPLQAVREDKLKQMIQNQKDRLQGATNQEPEADDKQDPSNEPNAPDGDDEEQPDEIDSGEDTGPRRHNGPATPEGLSVRQRRR